MRIAPEGGLYKTAVDDAPSPVALRLAQNSPNPFNPSTRVEFSLPRSGRARLDIFDAQGKWVDGLLNEERGPGQHSVVWHGTDSSGRNLPSGIYFCRLDALGRTLTRKMVLIK